MKNIENAIMINRSPEPRKSALPDILIYTIVTDMMSTTWNILEGQYNTTSEILKMRQRYTAKCKEYSRILHLAGDTNDENWAIQPIFTADAPIKDVPDPDEFAVIFPIGVKYNNTVYTFDIEAYFSALHHEYIPSVERMYAEKLSSVREQKNEDFPIIFD